MDPRWGVHVVRVGLSQRIYAIHMWGEMHSWARGDRVAPRRWVWCPRRTRRHSSHGRAHRQGSRRRKRHSWTHREHIWIIRHAWAHRKSARGHNTVLARGRGDCLCRKTGTRTRHNCWTTTWRWDSMRCRLIWIWFRHVICDRRGVVIRYWCSRTNREHAYLARMRWYWSGRQPCAWSRDNHWSTLRKTGCCLGLRGELHPRPMSRHQF